MDPSTIGAVLGSAFVVVFGVFKALDRFSPRPQRQAACPIDADPGIKALIAKLTDAQTTTLNMLIEMRTDHRLHDEHIAELRRIVDRERP